MDKVKNEKKPREVPERRENDLTKGYYNPELKKSVEYAKKYKTYSKIYSIVSLAVFSAVLLGISACLTLMKRPEISEIEKRELAKRPEFSFESFFSGSFTDDYSLYFSDTVPFRETIVNMGAKLRKLRGVSSPTFYGSVQIVADGDGVLLDTDIYEDDVFTQTAGAVTEPPVMRDDYDILHHPEENGTSAASSVTVPSSASSSSSQASEFANNGIVVDGVKMYGQNAGVMLFGGNKKQGSRYAEIINRYHEELGDEVSVWNIVVPTSAEFYLPAKFSKYSSSEKDAIDHIYANLAPGVNGVDAYSKLAEHSDEYIYFRTDHHWTPLGAYYAYTAFAEALGMEYHPIEDYEERIKYGFVGSLYGYTNDITLKNASEEFHYFMPPDVTYKTEYYDYYTLKSKGNGVLFHEYVDGANCYGMFLGADAIHAKITTGAGSGRKIVVFKESYGNAFVPFLVNNFDEIYVIDIRYFGRNAVDYIRQVKATDVLFIDNCFAANTSSLIAGIERLFESKYGTITAAAPSETGISSESGKNASGTKKTAVSSGKGKSKNTSAAKKSSGTAATTVSSPPQTAPPADDIIIPDEILIEE